MFDVEQIFGKIKSGMKLINENRSDKDKVYIKRHLPKDLILQKKNRQE